MNTRCCRPRTSVRRSCRMPERCCTLISRMRQLFGLHDRRYGPVPLACDFLFVSDTLRPHLKRIEVNLDTRVSDHQPVLLELAY